MLVKGRKVVEVLPTIGKEEEKKVERYLSSIGKDRCAIELWGEVNVRSKDMQYMDIYWKSSYIRSLGVCVVQGEIKVLTGAHDRVSYIKESLSCGKDVSVMVDLNTIAREIEYGQTEEVIEKVLYFAKEGEEINGLSRDYGEVLDYLGYTCYREDLVEEMTRPIWVETIRRWDK